ncbi:hypothetical protein [Rossellomorea sp. NPDC077527]|uniref:hypothetical protein n=1 Tax=Rossellomorea sp. NPDC077527 TaxID=3364510 RepID=UPI0037C56FD2
MEDLELLYKRENGDYLRYDSSVINKYIYMENISSKLRVFKIVTLVIAFLIILTKGMFDITSIEQTRYPKETICLLLVVAVIINYNISYYIHRFAYGYVSKSKRYIFIYGKLKPLNKILFIIIPDFLFALEYKMYIRKSHSICALENCHNLCSRDSNGEGICLSSWDSIKVDTKYFVLFSNWLNVIVASITIIITLIFIGINNWLVLLMFFVLSFRVFSRFVEIVIAFYKDVVVVEDKLFNTNDGNNPIYIHRWKNTLTLKSGRISLAIHSLLEVLMLFSAVYYYIYIFNILNSEGEILNLVGGEDIGIKYIHFVLYSIPVTGLNVSYGNLPNIIWNTTHIIQLLLSLILIILSLSSYIGMDNKISQRDKDLYLEVKKRSLYNASWGE